MDNKTQKHCINALTLFDWINKPSNMLLSKYLGGQVCVNDQVCGHIDIPCGEAALLWMVRGRLDVSGWVTICHQAGCEYMEVIVNGGTVLILEKEEEQTLYFHDLKSIEVQCSGNKEENCIGRYCFTLCYKINKCSYMLEDYQLSCFLSDEFGNPTDNLECHEVLSPRGRENIQVMLPNGKMVMLQKIKVIKKGFITLQLVNKEEICNLGTVFFQCMDIFILCAPKGTFITCDITNFSCTANMTDDCERIDIEISFFQQIKVITEMSIEVEANLCLPRDEVDMRLYVGCPD
ncbi:hypothetical protein CAI16_14775 [Virgibacillus dokdonensis]|uniref:Endospore appendages core domain-containing protein n=1 Tax=Virgibacillus dokdonensis TaxID=302167 RepID=A0A3E0WKT0_9BACI|nr:S-Ena type endospore appendage [Virgibacillus dokdonensis]RFA33408.1 hypothetical protein CAI16_14775 [Virgibacillus dokdonensis]